MDFSTFELRGSLGQISARHVLNYKYFRLLENELGQENFLQCKSFIQTASRLAPIRLTLL